MTERSERRLAAILSADVVGYTRLMHQDEEGTLARLRSYRGEVIEPEIAEHRGRVFKLMGDGLLAEFASAVDAVECATEIQRRLDARNAGLPPDEQTVLRVGINLGDVIVEGSDIYGDGVNVATRMQEIATPGGVTVSGIVYDSVRDKCPSIFEDLGPQLVKHIAEPVRTYRIVPERTTGSVQVAQRGPTTLSEEDTGRVLAFCSSTRRGGGWRVPANLQVTALMGSIDLDVREAEFSPGVTEIEVTNVMGWVGIIVPDHVAVECDGAGILGQFDSLARRTSSSAQGAPVLRISGVALMAHTTVR